MSQEAWIVDCTQCKCKIVAFGIDPQADHMQRETVTPRSAVVLECLCCGASYRYAGDSIYRGTPKRNPACLRKRPARPLDGAMLIATSIVTVIRLRGTDIKPSPKLNSTIYDAITLVQQVWSRLEKQL